MKNKTTLSFVITLVSVMLAGCFGGSYYPPYNPPTENYVNVLLNTKGTESGRFYVCQKNQFKHLNNNAISTDGSVIDVIVDLKLRNKFKDIILPSNQPVIFKFVARDSTSSNPSMGIRGEVQSCSISYLLILREQKDYKVVGIMSGEKCSLELYEKQSKSAQEWESVKLNKEFNHTPCNK